MPEALLLVATPLLYHYDRSLQDRMVSHPSLTRGDTRRGDGATLLLGAGAAAWAAGSLVSDGSTESLEIAVESYALTELSTEALKFGVHRLRPGGHSAGSFPSGHASFTFFAATFLARSTWDASDEWWHGLGYLAYLPAIYVGVNRVEGNRHFPSDVAAGALLGTFLTNLVYDAHVGDPARQRTGIFTSPVFAHMHFAPLIDPGGVGLALFFRF